jgi:ribosomal protein S18 acetylase RimI-like enzyme
MVSLKYASPGQSSTISELLNEELALGTADTQTVLIGVKANSYINIEAEGNILGFIRQQSVNANVLFKALPLLDGRLPEHQRYSLISNFYVRPEYRGKGYGNRLLSGALSAGQGLPAIAYSWHRPSGWMAESIFNKYEFECYGEIPELYRHECDNGCYICPLRSNECMCTSFIYYRRSQ